MYREWFESLNRASKVFDGNSSEFTNDLAKFVGRPTFVTELPDDFSDESARLLHNYLAALATLRDTQRSIHHKLWPVPDDSDPNRTRWEVTVWDPKESSNCTVATPSHSSSSCGTTRCTTPSRLSRW